MTYNKCPRHVLEQIRSALLIYGLRVVDSYPEMMPVTNAINIPNHISIDLSLFSNRPPSYNPVVVS